MAKHHVEVVTGWMQTTELGALAVADLAGSAEVVAPPRTMTTAYAAGQILTFGTKPDALRFVKVHGDRARYLGTTKPIAS